MTRQNDSTTLEQLMELLIQNGPDAMAHALATLLNHAMRVEREQALGAAAHQRTDTRRGYANGYKPKTLSTRLGVRRLALGRGRPRLLPPDRVPQPGPPGRGADRDQPGGARAHPPDDQGGRRRHRVRGNNDRRRRARALCIRNDDRLAPLHHRDDGVGCAQVDANDLTHSQKVVFARCPLEKREVDAVLSMPLIRISRTMPLCTVRHNGRRRPACVSLWQKTRAGRR